MKRLLPILLLSTACVSTVMTNSYRDPAAAGVHFKRIAAIAIVDNPEVRRVAEDEMVRQIGDRAVAGYSLLTPADEKSAEAVRAKLQQSGIDGAVTMRLLSIGEEPIDVRGEIGDGSKAFSGYYGRAKGPGPDAWEKVARVETQIFSVPDNKLLWAGTTKSFEPNQAAQVVSDVAKAVAAEVKK